MPWFKVDDGLAFHPKVVEAGNAAMGLWVRAGSWAGAHLTDGFVPDHMLRVLAEGDLSLVEALVDAGLWHRDQGGVRFHEWDERQPSRDKVKREREGKSARQARWRARLAADRDASGDAPVDASTDASRDALETPAPTRPVPTRTEHPSDVPGEREGDAGSTSPEPADDGSGSASRKRSAASTRGTRLPDDWQPSAADREWFAGNCPTLAAAVRGREVTDTFRDYWHAESGSRATKRDWSKAWKVWARREEGRAAQQARRGPGGRPTDDERVRAFAAATALPDHGHGQPYDIPLPGTDQGGTVYQLPRSEAR